MSRSRTLVFWSPRVLGLIVVLFLATFALDAFSPGKPLLESARDFLVHLIPALAVLTVLAAGWRHPHAGALGCVFLAACYAWYGRGHLAWIVIVSGPLLMTALLFVLSGRRSIRS